jgi:hypothetical protein
VGKRLRAKLRLALSLPKGARRAALGSAAAAVVSRSAGGSVTKNKKALSPFSGRQRWITENKIKLW